MPKKIELKADIEGVGKAGEVVELRNADAKKLIEAGHAAEVDGDGGDDAETVKVALLADSHAGKAGEVVELPRDVAEALILTGQADDNESAVAHREAENGPKQDQDKALS